ncbi:MAG: hypothetical protein JSS69_12080 [Acidobacteria bacterium]|nr:hypothetical protein [Acidobacteriota bacterium]MBS1866643.1 hypothetical protein [Acidobacteriota bacterium]
MMRANAQEEPEQQGVEQGNYNVKQSIEFGGRFVDVTGSSQSYDTFINLQQGPRLLGFTTEMRSLNHQGGLFDRLYFSNFGYGGDPNNVSRLRISKNKWYNFDALFRRDENFWDYSLLANPLNPVTPPFANAPASFTPIISTSPHLLNTRRRLGDYNLLLLPQSRMRFRFGYARNINEGPSFTTIHQGTEQLLFQDWKTTVNTYRAGVDFRLFPRTNISYDEIWNYYKGDTGSTDQNQLFALSNGQLVDIGVSLNAGANQPCANTFIGPPAGNVNPTCSAYFNFLRHARTRTSGPTEQVSLQSNYWKALDFSARASYTGGDADVFGYNQSFGGREARTNLRNDATTGSMKGRRVVATADFGATWHITDRLSFLDSFHFSNFHYPMEFNSTDCGFFSASLLVSARVFTPGSPVPVNCAAPSDSAAGTPTHSASSGPDITIGVNSNFLKQDEKTNLTELQYQFSPKLGARGGFRYRHRSIDDNFFSGVTEVFFPSNANRGDCAIVAGVLKAGCVANGDGSFTFVTPDPAEGPGETQINEYAGVFGIWAQPTSNWRISFDTELMSADNAFTRISPRQSQEYRIRSKYRVTNWLSLDGSIRIWEARNNISEVDNLQHDRSYGFSAMIQPNEKFALELGYDYNDVFSQILICYVSSTAPAGLAKCPGSTVLVEQLSTYTNNSHYGHFDVMWVPVHRLTTHLGANLTGTNGSAILLNPNAVPGPLNSKWLQPYGGLDYHFAKNWTGKAYWGYHGYHEDLTSATQDVFVPRNFHANTATLSLRYAF